MLRILFSCHGRMGRSTMWIIVPVSLVLAALGAVVWYSQFTDLKSAIEDLGWEALLPTLLDPLPHLIATVAILALFLLWWHIARALMVKRLHDRGRKGTWLILLVAAVIGLLALPLMPELAEPAQFVEGGLVALALGVIVAFARELFWMKGTEGENRYGPEPRTS